MSAIVGILKRDMAYVATDTLARDLFQEGDTYVKPSHFASKTFHLPQFKSIFGVTGYQAVGLVFYEFLTQRCIGSYINSIVNIDPEIFREEIQIKHSIPLHGTIYLYGVDNNSNEFKGYWLPVNKQDEPMTWRPLKYTEQDTFAMAMVPQVDNWSDQIIEGPNKTMVDLMNELVIIQKRDDESKPIEQQVGIGGEIVVTQIAHTEEGKLIICSFVTHTFSDYDKHFDMMLNKKSTILNRAEP